MLNRKTSIKSGEMLRRWRFNQRKIFWIRGHKTRHVQGIFEIGVMNKQRKFNFKKQDRKKYILRKIKRYSFMRKVVSKYKRNVL